jgi:2,3-bisphosphoglycerate-independent phosphoglycerate mutase
LGKLNPRKSLLVVMDGVGLRDSRFGNAVNLARTPNLKFLMKRGYFTTLAAHGTAVGLPSDADMGNSEVGHNALGAGQIFDQGAKLVGRAIDSGVIFSGNVWQSVCKRGQTGAVHFIGLLSDGNVHSHEQHLFALLNDAKSRGVKKCFVHVLLDGRDVPEKSAEVYVERLEKTLSALSGADFVAKVASGGGRMTVTMDRYEADWSIVERGWNAHVHGAAQDRFPSLSAAIAHYRKSDSLTDQYLPPFVIVENNRPVGTIKSGDAVVFFNFRGDRAVQISQAFTQKSFSHFDRGAYPETYFAGMMQYDGDLALPENYLVGPPTISNTMGEHFASLGLRQFACSETQKYGHVTYFWNGNRSGKFDAKLEEYLEIPSDRIQFDLKPAMKACEITDVTIERMRSGSFDFGRINYANGDMVGHTGNLEAAVIAVATVDLMLGRLIKAAAETQTQLMVTADHGNADEMFEGKEKDFPDWDLNTSTTRPKPKTAHTLNPVPFIAYDPTGRLKITPVNSANVLGLGNVASTCAEIMGVPALKQWLPSCVKVQR